MPYLEENIKVIILHNIFAPYREGFFQEVSKLPGIELTVYYCSGKSPGRKWKVEPKGYNYKVLKGITFGKFYHINLGIIFHLIKDKPDILVVGGYSYPTAVIAIAMAGLLNIPLGLWSESNLIDERNEKQTFLTQVKSLLLSKLVAKCMLFLVPGRAARKYLKSHGASSNSIFTVPNAVDNRFFRKKSRKIGEKKQEIKEKLKIEEDLLFLYIGRLIAKKGVNVLLESFRGLKEEFSNVALLVVGNGPLQGKYKSWCKSNNVDGVYFFDFEQRTLLPAFYGVSDLFILPSRGDQWGLVINEAMACGLPIITTDKVGAGYDLVYSSKNGLVVEAGNSDDLKRAMLRIIEKSDKQREKMGKLSQEIISKYTHREAASRFLKAVKSVKVKE